jgi:elongation factor G
MRSGIHDAIQNQSFIPLFCTSASINVGVTRFMEFVSKYGSSPVDRGTVIAKSLKSDEQISVDLNGDEPEENVFKTISEAHVGDLSFFRVYSGSVNAGMDMLNTTRSKTERFGQMFLLNGKNRMSVNHLNAGDIGAVVKLKDTHTSNTLCSQKFQVIMDTVLLP